MTAGITEVLGTSVARQHERLEDQHIAARCIIVRRLKWRTCNRILSNWSGSIVPAGPYAKGLETWFLAIERLLETRPDLLEKVFLLQVAQPSRQEVRAYADIHRRLDALSGRINGRYGTVDWTPIRYLIIPMTAIISQASIAQPA